MSDRNQLERYAGWLSIAILSGVFGYSGLHKLFNPEAFALAVFRYHLLPYAIVNVISLWITWLEITCAFILLFLPRFRAGALWFLLLLLLTFSAGIGINLARGSQMSCGCFSTAPMARPIGWLGLLRNAGLIVLVLYVISRQSNAEND